MIFRVAGNACLFTISSAFSPSQEQTGLLQNANRGQILITEANQDKVVQVEASTKLNKLFESTSQLLRAGSTPAVIKFTEDVLKDITDAALPAIRDSSTADDKLLKESVAAFKPIIAKYQSNMAAFETLRNAESTSSAAHKSCRVQETEECSTFTTCTEELHTDWVDYQDKKSAFHVIHDIITGGICPTPTPAQPWGTFPNNWKLGGAACQVGETGCEYKKNSDGNYTWTYRTHIEDYTAKGQLYFAAKDKYEAKKIVCTAEKQDLKTKTEECAVKQKELEISSCASKRHHKEWQDVFDETFRMAQANLAQNKKNVQSQQDDRIIEYSSIKSIQCLLQKIQESGGMPCDEKSGNGTADAQIAQCRIIDIDTTEFNLTYPDEPARPAQTAVAPHACEASFVAQEYDDVRDLMQNQQCGRGSEPSGKYTTTIRSGAVSTVGDEIGQATAYTNTVPAGTWIVQLSKPVCDASNKCDGEDAVSEWSNASHSQQWCAKQCKAHQYCCNDPKVGSKFISCTQACLMRSLGVSKTDVKGLCDKTFQGTTCSLDVPIGRPGHDDFRNETYSFCGTCTDCAAGVQGVQSPSECTFGADVWMLGRTNNQTDVSGNL